jgi:hypothetical protein
MKFIRSHINSILKVVLGTFSLSWILLVLAVPVQVAAMGESHQIFSIYNADEGCFELVVDHHEDADGFHLMDEENDAHSFHNSCCFDDLALTYKKQDTDFDLPLSYENEGFEFNLLSKQKQSTVTLQEHPLPPPVMHQSLQITRLLI